MILLYQDAIFGMRLSTSKVARDDRSHLKRPDQACVHRVHARRSLQCAVRGILGLHAVGRGCPFNTHYSNMKRNFNLKEPELLTWSPLDILGRTKSVRIVSMAMNASLSS